MLPVAVPARADPGPVLVARWSFDEGSGTTAGDSGALPANNGTVYGATWVDGKFGKALYFDGIYTGSQTGGDYVFVPGESSLHITDQLTVEAWIKPTGIPDRWYGDSVRLGLGYELCLRGDGKLEIALRRAGAWGWWDSLSAISIPASVFYHVAFTFNKDGGANNLKIYINGVLDGQYTIGTAPLQSSGDLWIGPWFWPFEGVIDEVRIWNQALTAAQLNDMTAPAGSVAINSDAPYTNSTSVTLNLAATDAVGVTGYRVANGTDASGGTTVVVSSTTSFSANISWTLPSGDGTKTVAVQYRDAAANWSPNYTDSIILDQTPPTLTKSLSGTAGSAGWYTSNVTVTLTGGDPSPGSGLNKVEYNLNSGGWTTYTVPFVISTEGTNTLEHKATDNAGNVFVLTAQTIKIDTTPPIVTPGTAPTYILNQPGATVNATVTDATSGPAASPVTVSVSTAAVGSFTAPVTGYDVAGNSTTVNCPYNVNYGFLGLLPPYVAPPKAFKMGSSIPLKWQYTDFAGTVVNSSAANPSIQIVNSLGASITLNDPGNSGLRYDSASNMWHFNWQTKGLQPGIYNISITSGQSGQTNGPFSIQLK